MKGLLTLLEHRRGKGRNARAELDNGALSKERAFEIAYGRRPSAAETEQLRHPDLAGGNEPASQLRSVIACFDRQRLPTPLSVRFTERDLERVECGGFSLVLDRCDISVSRSIIASQQYEPHLSALLRRIVKPGMTAVDIGANVGFYTMLLGERVGRSGRVLAFEPNTENCRLLMLSIDANGFNHIKLYPFALSTNIGAAFFTSHIGSNGGFLPNVDTTVTDPNCVVVPSIRLDTIVTEPVHFIKADVEGAEYLAFSGGEGLLRQFHPVITAEFSLEMLQRVSGISGADFLKWMKNLGYRAYLVAREGPIEEIDDVDTYLSGWGSQFRIEDIAFIPQELNFDPRYHEQ
jgi:FkbM family methyltransferase